MRIGVKIGTTFSSRREVAAAGVDRAIQAGMTGTGATGAESIVVSGGYEDDQDNGWEIVYTGHGGRDEAGGQVTDQTFDAPGDAALQTATSPAPRSASYAARTATPPMIHRPATATTACAGWNERGANAESAAS